MRDVLVGGQEIAENTSRLLSGAGRQRSGVGVARHAPCKIQDKCVVKIERLRELGHELRRPEADLLRNGIYELRIGREGMNYRILYFFHGRMAAVLAHGLAKEREVPTKDIQVALERKRCFERDPYTHTYREE
ncbi:MAG: type II toxin-antitoxin system RelE/ParE family toxin [Nitrospira sp.]|nr:type II toxin-antitoxin system RelE/ParE family toxin [Nitrospira sp.]